MKWIFNKNQGIKWGLKENIRMHSSKLEFYEVFQKKKEENFHNKSLFYIEIYISHIDDFSLGKLYISELYFLPMAQEID